MEDTTLDRLKTEEFLNSIDVGYIKECIREQLEDWSGSGKKNHLKSLENQLNGSDVDDIEYIRATADSIYSDIISIISEKFKFTIDTSMVKISQMAKCLYKFFCINYQDNITFFLENVIIENQKIIAEELLARDGINTRDIPDIPHKISIILNNLPLVIDIISGMDYNIHDFVDYILMHEDAKPSAQKFKDYLDNEYLSDYDETMEVIMNPIITEQEGFGDICANLQLNIYQRFADEK